MRSRRPGLQQLCVDRAQLVTTRSERSLSMKDCRRLTSRFVFLPVVVAMVLLGRGRAKASADGGAGSSSGRAARLYLTPTLLARLQERAAAADPAWAALKTHCDSVASGTFNNPSQQAYPNLPDVGQGYEGDGYLPEVMNLGLCYRVESGVDDASAEMHAAAGVRLLETIATPVASGGQDPSTDDGYGIRNYGVAMATGFDWMYPAMTASDVSDIVTSLNLWVNWFDSSGFCNAAPISNYFQGYLLAKTATAIATAGDNESATAYWSDVQSRLWTQLTQPQFAASMVGGGWPEGWEYGPRAVEEYTQFLFAAKTGEQLDWWSQTPNAHDEAAYITYFAWPSRLHMDDQGTVHSQAILSPPGVTMAYLSGLLQDNADPYAATARSATAALVATNADVFAPWESFFYVDPSLPLTDYTLQPLSYFASGPNHVAVRSTWSTDGVWGTLVSGTYIDSPDSGEQLFNQGSVAVVQGDQPILVNATGWLPQANGAAGEDLVYDDAWTNETRLLANTFYAAGTKQGTTGPTQASTRVSHYEEGGTYVRARGTAIEEMYLPVAAVAQFTRDFVYLRPGTFVIYDRTTVADGSADQWTAWHTPTVPSLVATPDATQVRYDVSAAGGVVGSVRSLLPRSADSTVVNVLGTVSRIENHAPNPEGALDWLTVVTAGSDVPAEIRLSAADGNVASGGALGVVVLSQPNNVVLFSDDHAAATPIRALTYTVAQSAAAEHVLVDVAPSPTGYAVTTTVSRGSVTVAVSPGGPFEPTSEGTLVFAVSLSGSVSSPATAGVGDAGGGVDGGAPMSGGIDASSLADGRRDGALNGSGVDAAVAAGSSGSATSSTRGDAGSLHPGGSDSDQDGSNATLAQDAASGAAGPAPGGGCSMGGAPRSGSSFAGILATLLAGVAALLGRRPAVARVRAAL